MSRQKILDKVNAALAGAAPIEERRRAVSARLASPPRHPLPQRVQKPTAELTAQFADYLKACLATVIEVESAAGVRAAIATYLREQNLPQRIVHGADAYLAALPWSQEPALQRKVGPAAGSDEVALSRARAGVAETGTLVMASGADNPVTLNFLPETHIVVVEESNIVGPYEDAFAALPGWPGQREMPRTVNLITGPSRTADIGGRLVIGAHGPRRLCVLIVKGR